MDATIRVALSPVHGSDPPEEQSAPSTGLRRAFHSGGLPWPEFVEAYRAELTDETAARGAVAHLRALALREG
ncbi:DUF488 family protein [Actinomyces gaoshouyii]|uniref:Uncharacterized protein n=1 Tax=Actinomyces gaoshouyii TaxID=1960083 RepID=A0A8H9HD12_9ACTO|nr:DUF488 family protein [Actinomyces gaoshouyii]GGO98281.1 hypothetical protein GCM10011612_12850 [Actinomyces gaoshouyii]